MNTVLETITFNPVMMQSVVQNDHVNDYTPEELLSAKQYNMTVPEMRATIEAAKRYPNVACDENGMPIGCTVPEWFDKLDKRLIEDFGEEYRQLANKRRRKDNQRGLWKFEML